MASTKEYAYKLQGDGRDSWSVKEFDENGILINAYMVDEDPNQKPVPIVNVVGLLQSMSLEELEQVKQILR